MWVKEKNIADSDIFVRKDNPPAERVMLITGNSELLIINLKLFKSKTWYFKKKKNVWYCLLANLASKQNLTGSELSSAPDGLLKSPAVQLMPHKRKHSAKN